MATEADPVIGNWYQHLDKGQKFEVVAVDEQSGTVELQHFDGDVEEVELEQWYDWDVEPIEAPENYSGPMDDFEVDDLEYTDTEMDRSDWIEPARETRAAPLIRERPSEAEREDEEEPPEEGLYRGEPWSEE